MNSNDSKKRQKSNVFALLKVGTATLFGNKDVFFPYFLMIFIQFFIIEILYFFPRFPLNKFFGPLVSRLFGEPFLHYPENFLLIPKLYQYVQMPLFVILTSYLMTCSIQALIDINQSKTVNTKKIFKKTLGSYVHIFIAAFIAVCCLLLLFSGFEKVLERAARIRSKEGIYYWIKMAIMVGSPFINLLMSVFITTIFAYVFPIIVYEKVKVFAALWRNFKFLFGSFWRTLFMTLFPSLIFACLILFRIYFPLKGYFPELSVLIMLVSSVVMVIVDGIIYTTLTTYYLSQKDEK